MAAKLQCEICGGKLIGRPGGIYECDSCGMEYDTAWAKAKIQEITGTVKVEGTVEVTGKVQVENGGPSADSLIKRGMMLLEDLDHATGQTYDEHKEKKAPIRDCFMRALEIDPENAGAYLGLYLTEEGVTTDKLIANAPDMMTLEDEHGYWKKAQRYASGPDLELINQVESLWKTADQTDQLPAELRKCFALRNGTLVRISDKATALRQIMIPSSVTRIGYEAFKDCEHLKTVQLTDGLLEIDACAFENCSSLDEITIPETVIKIGYDAFDSCRTLRKITLPGGLKELDDGVFMDCTALAIVDLPEGIIRIGGSSFENCTALTELSIPSSVKVIGDKAFCGCKSLHEIHLPEAVHSVGEYAFFECESLTDITLSDKITVIEPYTFGWCRNLKTVTLPSQTKKLGEGAFEGCESLAELTIPPSVVEIEKEAFESCSALKKIQLPPGVETVAERLFRYCMSLTSVIIPEGVSKIGERAFENCGSLKSVRIPESVRSYYIEKNAFGNCNNLTLQIEGGGNGHGSASDYAEKYHVPWTALPTREEKQKMISLLTEERQGLQKEIENLKGLFAGVKKSKIESRLAEIEAELKKLG